MRFPRISPRTQLLFAASAILILAEAAAVHPAKVDKTLRGPLLEGAQIPSPVLSSLERACQNCHSQNTEWPWYSSIPPISWQIHSDVTQARQFMDFSKWSSYSDAEKRGMLTAMTMALQTHVMPPTKYVWLHPEAKLSDAEQRALADWAKGEQQRIAKQPPVTIGSSN
jgi:hypothetical protein